VYPTTKDAFETQVSFKGEFDSEKAGKKMRDIIYENWLLHMERDLWKKESTILQKWRMEESFYTWNAFVVWARVWLRQSRINNMRTHTWKVTCIWDLDTCKETYERVHYTRDLLKSPLYMKSDIYLIHVKRPMKEPTTQETYERAHYIWKET